MHGICDLGKPLIDSINFHPWGVGGGPLIFPSARRPIVYNNYAQVPRRPTNQRLYVTIHALARMVLGKLKTFKILLNKLLSL